MKIKDGYSLRPVADGGVVISLNEMDCGHLMTVGGSGLYIWKLLEKDISFDKLIEQMLMEYDADEQTLKSDVRAFLDKLQKAGVLDE